MNSYIDETSKEEFTEDITIREALDSIDDMLASWTKEERLAFFATFAKPKDIDFVKEIGGITMWYAPTLTVTATRIW